MNIVFMYYDSNKLIYNVVVCTLVLLCLLYSGSWTPRCCCGLYSIRIVMIGSVERSSQERQAYFSGGWSWKSRCSVVRSGTTHSGTTILR